jgi:hypothetical protein
MPKIGDTKKCEAQQRCAGTMTYRVVPNPGAAFRGDGAQHPEQVDGRELWVCDTCLGEWPDSN